MIVISVLSLKGGVGKTSETLGLASAAGAKGLSTLVIDLDPQGNATSLLRARARGATVADVLAKPTKETITSAAAPSAWKLKSGRVDVVASDPRVIRFDAWIEGKAFTPKLRRAIRQLEGYDVVLIDCPPSTGALSREALAASDFAVIVTTPSYFGAQGAESALVAIEEIQSTVNPDLQFAGIVVNRLKEKTEEHRWRKKELTSIYGSGALLKPALPDRVAVQQAESAGEPIHRMKSSGAREISEIYDRHLAKLLRKSRPSTKQQPS